MKEHQEYISSESENPRVISHTTDSSLPTPSLSSSCSFPSTDILTIDLPTSNTVSHPPLAPTGITLGQQEPLEARPVLPSLAASPSVVDVEGDGSLSSSPISRASRSGLNRNLDFSERIRPSHDALPLINPSIPLDRLPSSSSNSSYPTVDSLNRRSRDGLSGQQSVSQQSGHIADSRSALHSLLYTDFSDRSSEDSEFVEASSEESSSFSGSSPESVSDNSPSTPACEGVEDSAQPLSWDSARLSESPGASPSPPQPSEGVGLVRPSQGAVEGTSVSSAIVDTVQGEPIVFLDPCVGASFQQVLNSFLDPRALQPQSTSLEALEDVRPPSNKRNFRTAFKSNPSVEFEDAEEAEVEDIENQPPQKRLSLSSVGSIASAVSAPTELSVSSPVTDSYSDPRGRTLPGTLTGIQPPLGLPLLTVGLETSSSSSSVYSDNGLSLTDPRRLSKKRHREGASPIEQHPPRLQFYRTSDGDICMGDPTLTSSLMDQSPFPLPVAASSDEGEIAPKKQRSGGLDFEGDDFVPPLASPSIETAANSPVDAPLSNIVLQQANGSPERKKSRITGGVPSELPDSSVGPDDNNWAVRQAVANECYRYPDNDPYSVEVPVVKAVEREFYRNENRPNTNDEEESISSDQAQCESEKRSDVGSIDGNERDYPTDSESNAELTVIDRTDVSNSPSLTEEVANIWYQEMRERTEEDDTVEREWRAKQNAANREENKPPINPSIQADQVPNGLTEGDLFPDDGKKLQQKQNDDRTMQLCDFSRMRNLPPPQPNELEWVIEEFLSYRDPQHTTLRIWSPPKTYNSITFRLLVYPRNVNFGNREYIMRPSSPGDVSIYLAVDPTSCFPAKVDQWSMAKSDYQIAAISWRNWRENSIVKTESFAFCHTTSDRGWGEFLPKDLLVPGELLGPEGQLVLRAQLCPKPADVNMHYISRQEGGYLGIKNQGATCYLNSLVQSLFHIGKFRESVFKFTVEKDKNFIERLEHTIGPLPDPTSSTDEEDATDAAELSDDEIKAAFDDSLETVSEDQRNSDIASSLQALFLHLQNNQEIANTDDLLKSFGWDSNESLTQHDAQELNRLLCDRLEEQMKGTPMVGAIEKLFMGEMESYIECVNVEYVSSRKEKFYDLQLDVKGNPDLLESLKKYTAEEMLEGDNAYDAEEYGKQSARKGVRFLRFPPVLQFHLKRFTFDPTRMDMVKVNQHFGYPEILDLDGILPGSGKYSLFCVVVHAGDVGGGHYYVISRPGGQEYWVRFDDEKVYNVTPNAALADSFGGHDQVCTEYLVPFEASVRNGLDGRLGQSPVKLHSAYMVFYAKCDLASELLVEPVPEKVNPYLLKRSHWEEKQRKRRLAIRQAIESRVRLLITTETSLRGTEGFLTDYHNLPTCREMTVERNCSMVALWQEFKKEIENSSLDLVFLPKDHPGIWYWNGEPGNRQVGRIADVRPTPTKITDKKKQTVVWDHFSLVNKNLKARWKPTLAILVHPLFHNEPPRNVPDLNLMINEQTMFIFKFFNPGKGIPEQQTIVTFGIASWTFSGRRSPQKQLVEDALQVVKVVDLENNCDGKIKDRVLLDFIGRFKQGDPALLKQLENCIYIETAGSFEHLGNPDDLRQQPKPDTLIIVVFALPPSDSQLIDRRDAALSYGMKQKTFAMYEEDTSITSAEAPMVGNRITTSPGAVDPVAADDSPNALPCPSSLDGTVMSPEVNELCQVKILSLSQKVQASRIQLMKACDGLSSCVVEARLHPPKMPKFLSCTPIDWEQALTRSKLTVVLKLYDVMATLGRWEDASWRPVEEEGPPVSFQKESYRSPQRLHEELKAGEVKEGSKTPDFLTARSHSASVESNLGARTKEDGTDGIPKETTSTATTARLTPDGGASDGHQDLPSVRLRCPVVKECTVDVDLRWPYLLGLKRLAWELNIEFEYALILASPPLTNDTEAFSRVSLPSNPDLQWSASNRVAPTLIEMPDRLDILHSALGSRQNQIRYRSIISPADEMFHSNIQYHFTTLPRAVSTLTLGLDPAPPLSASSVPVVRCIPIRVFNSRVESVGLVLVDIDRTRPITVAEVIDAALQQVTPTMETRGADPRLPHRLVWIGTPRPTHQFLATHQLVVCPNRLDVMDDQLLQCRLPLLDKGFQYDTPLRIEPDFTSEELSSLQSVRETSSLDTTTRVSVPGAPRSIMLTVLHQNRDRQFFGSPFNVIVSSSDTLKKMKAKIRAKLGLSEERFAEWKFLVFDYDHTSFTRDDEIPDFSKFPESACLLAMHRNIYSSEDRSKTLQLHIK